MNGPRAFEWFPSLTVCVLCAVTKCYKKLICVSNSLSRCGFQSVSVFDFHFAICVFYMFNVLAAFVRLIEGRFVNVLKNNGR